LGISALHSAALADLTFTVVQDIGSVLSSERSSAWGPAKPHPYDALIRALARAHRWKRSLEEGNYRSAGEQSEVERATRSFMNRLLRLTLPPFQSLSAITKKEARQAADTGASKAACAGANPKNRQVPARLAKSVTTHWLSYVQSISLLMSETLLKPRVGRVRTEGGAIEHSSVVRLHWCSRPCVKEDCFAYR
jgi:hypothetical protein